MFPHDQVLVDVFTPFNVLTGAFARSRGANLGTLLIIGVGFELAQNALVHYYGDRLGLNDRDPSANFAVGLLATAAGWALADAALKGAFSHDS